MFGSKSKESNQSTKGNIKPMSTPSINSLVTGTTVEGTIHSDHDIRIDGKVKGVINCKAKVIIGPSGLVTGEIYCQNAMIEGTFEGVIKVQDTLQIKDNAKVEGDIQTDKLSVQPGAIFNVSCVMDENSKKVQKPAVTKPGEKKQAPQMAKS